MRSLRILGVLVSVTLSASAALAQFGLYGAPEVLRLPQTQSDAIPQYTYASASAVSPGGTAQVPNLAPIPEPMPAGQPNSVGQMLRDAQPCNGAPVQGGPCGEVQSSTTWEPRGCNVGAGCGPAAPCAPVCDVGCECPWYASADWLIMSRDKSNRVWTTYESGNDPNQLMNTWDMETEWSNGGEIRVGRWFCCNQWAVEVGYWTLSPMNGFSSMTNAAGVSTPLAVDDIEFDGINGVTYFDGAAEHRIWRRDEFHNVEINLVGRGWTGDSCNAYSPWDFRWAAGVRFFRFSEDLRFGSLDAGFEWGQDGGEHEAYLSDKIRNNLIGPQVGCNVQYQFRDNLGFFFAPKFGVYNNHIEHTFTAYRGDGVIATPTAESEAVGSYPVNGSGNFLSFLTEANVGVNWHITPNWSAQVGYRVVAATGIGLADHQIPHFVVDFPELAATDHNGNLLVHGAFAGVSYNY